MNEREQRELDELLMNSSQGENIQQITELIEAGAKINAVTTGGNQTSLHTAVRCDHKEVAELLLNKGANINAVERREWAPLHAAVRYSCEELVELLLDRVGNVNTVDNLGMASLHSALKCGREELVGLLLNKGASVNAVDKKGRTPLSTVASDYYQGYCDKPMLVRTIIVYAVLHCGITTKPEYIVENSELSELWDYCQSEITCHLTNKEFKNIIQAFPSQNLDNPSADQLQAAVQAHNQSNVHRPMLIIKGETFTVTRW